MSDRKEEKSESKSETEKDHQYLEDEDEDFDDIKKNQSMSENKGFSQTDMFELIKAMSRTVNSSYEKHESVREKNLNSSQKTFSGRVSENIDQWVESINLNMQVASIPEHRMLIVAAGYLHDNALFFYQQEAKTKDLDWQTFQFDLIKRFRPSNYQGTLFNKLALLKQKTALDKHLEQFTFIANQLDKNSMTEFTKMQFFIQSLDEDMRAYVANRSPKDFEESIEFA